MHTDEVFFHMVCSVELFETKVAVERLVILVDVLVTRVQVTSVSGIGTVWTIKSFICQSVAGIDPVLYFISQFLHQSSDLHKS